jgi:tetratricopeptide (TPR) repeat protein
MNVESAPDALGPPTVLLSTMIRFAGWLCHSTLSVCLIGAAASPLPLLAQGGKKDAPEFTQQGLLIANFAPLPGADMKFARRTSDAVRSRLGKLVNKREVEVVDGGDVAWELEKAGYNPDTSYTPGEIRAIGHHFRTDEYVIANVSNGPGGVRITGDLVLLRDERLRQPLPIASAPKLDSAAALFAQSIAAARAQLVFERRCENALRDGSAERALESARQGVAAYPRGTIARTCLLWAMRQRGTPATLVLTTAEEVLAIDTVSVHALEAAATALDSLRRRDDAARHWLRLAASDTNDLDLALRISYALLDAGNAKYAETFVSAISDAHPDDLRFVQQKWRAAYENKSWARAIAAGEVLIARDTMAKRDSVFYLKLGAAYRAINKPFKAIETLAHGVAAFPKDARLYSAYTQAIKSEADTVVPRGLALFPKNSDLLTISAKELRTKGKVQESLDATKMAVSLDSTMKQGQLMVAQLEIELGRPDSALAALHRALASGEDTVLVAQFALAKGNTMYRAANGTKTSADFALALRVLAFADSVQSSQQSRFLMGASALGAAQAMVTDASKVKDKVESCRLMRAGADLIPVARSGITAGEEMFAEAAKQALDFLDQLDPYAQQQLKLTCADPA